MLRRTGFARKVYVAPRAAPLRRVERSGVIARVSANVAAMPRPERHENRRLLDMARDKPCLLRVPNVCNFDVKTTVACHSNLSIHGKAGARKADDEYSVWGCSACHEWLDRGKADALAKELAFMLAHLSQVGEWRAIAASTAGNPLDRAAAQWALNHLNASPLGEGEVL